MQPGRTSVNVGTTVPHYTRRDYTRFPKEINLDDVWQIVGPTVDMHIRNLPLWKLLCTVYLEGLAHGSQAVASKKEPT